MNGTVNDLLQRLQSQIDSYELHAGRPDPAWHELSRSWVPLAEIALRCNSELGLTRSPSPMHLTLRRISESGNLQTLPPLNAHWRLGKVTETLGVLGDLLSNAPRPDLPIVDRASRILGADIENLVARIALVTLRSKPPTMPPDRLAKQLAAVAHGYDAQAAPGASYLHHWRKPRAFEPTIDAAANAWAHVARETLESATTVTSVSLQLVAADIALLCAAAARLQEPSDLEGARSARTAAQAWIQAAQWPTHLVLGGRTKELREASRRLRVALSPIVQQAHPAQQPPSDSNDAPTDPGLASRLLHAAHQVGKAYSQRCDRLLLGDPQLWIDQESVPSRYLTVAQQMHGTRFLPAPHDLRSATEISTNSASAQHALGRARRDSWTALGRRSAMVDSLAIAWETIRRSQVHSAHAQRHLDRAVHRSVEPPIAWP